MTDAEIEATLKSASGQPLNPADYGMTPEELVELLKRASTEPDAQEKIRKAVTSSTGPVEDVPVTVASMLEKLDQRANKPGDTFTKGGLLPLSKNDRTGAVGLDITAGLPGSMINALTAPERVLTGEYNDVFTAPEGDYSEGDSAVNAKRWNDFIGEGLNMAGNITLGTAPIAEPVPNSLNIEFAIPARVKQAMSLRRAGQPPTAFEISTVDIHAPKNLKSLERPSDLYKTYALDDKQVLGDLAERAGIPNLSDMVNRIDQDTQNTALMRVNEALRTGKLTTANGQFDTSVMPPEILYRKYKALPKEQQVDADQYLKLRDYTDDLRLMQARGIRTAWAQGELATVGQSLQQIEQRTPIVKELAQGYRNITDQARQFLASGPNGMFSPKALQALNQERPNYVPIDITGVNPADPLLARIADANKSLEKASLSDWFLQARDLNSINGIDNRVDSFEILQDYVRNSLQHKMANDVRGEFIKQLQGSSRGKETIRELLPDEAGKYGDRVVNVYEGGEKKNFLTSKLQRDLLQFDPYIAKFPALYSLKRLFEVGTTGPLSVTFAPVTAIRDALTGSVLREKGLPAPGLFGTIAAIPEQFVPKMTRALSETLKQSTNALPFIDSATRQQLGATLANRYARSLYALSNEVGGIDASLMKSNIQSARGVWREVSRSLSDSTEKLPGVHTLGHSLKELAHGWDALFGAISDAPRFAVFKKAVNQGMNPSEAAVMARRIAGDTSRGGKPYLASGQRIQADVQNKGALAFAPQAAWLSAAARETLPYFNPAVQGLRRLATRLVADPVRTQLNAWKYVGLPGLAAYGWNEMLGKEYNDYAQQHRSDYDTAMNMYVGIPGLPPERGIEIPLGHEMTPWLSPWSAALYSLGRGDEDIKKTLMHRAAVILKNGSMIGYPQAGALLLNASGINPPQSILTPMDDVYQMREDNVGFLPENVEKLSRTMFGSISDMALMSAAAAHDGGPGAFFDELGWQVGKRLPIVKNLIGAKTAVNSFSPKSEEIYRKTAAFDKFLDVWDQHYGPHADLVQSKLTNKPDGMEMLDPVLGKLGPNVTPTPTNPVFKQFGDLVHSYMDTNDDGMSALKNREGAIKKQLDLLKGYTAGRRGEFKKYQEYIKDAPMNFDVAVEELNSRKGTMNSKEFNKAMKDLNSSLGEQAKAAQLLDDMKIDLSNRSDVMRLINKLEMDRYSIINQKAAVIKQLEDKLTQELNAAGILPAGVKFDIEKHLSPTVPMDFLDQPSQTQGKSP